MFLIKKTFYIKASFFIFICEERNVKYMLTMFENNRMPIVLKRTYKNL